MEQPIEIIGKELFTLDAYLKNEEMIMHHERFKKMIRALKSSIVALKFTQFIIEEFQNRDGIDFEGILKAFQCRER